MNHLVNHFFIATFAVAVTPVLAEPVLQITGNLDAPGKAGVGIELSALTSLPAGTLSLKRNWERAPSTFTGPLLRDVLVGFKGVYPLAWSKSNGVLFLVFPVANVDPSSKELAVATPPHSTFQLKSILVE